MSWVAVAIGGAALVSGMASAEDAEDAAHAQAQSQSQMNAIQAKLAEMSLEEWDLYKKHALPMLEELTQKRTTTDRTAEETALAAGDTKAAYAAGRRALTRRLGIDESMDSPRTAAILRPAYMDEAAAVSRAITEARRQERDRVENFGWNRSLQAIQAFQRLPQTAGSNLQGAGAIAARNAAISGSMAQAYNQDASQAAYGGTSLALGALQRWRRPQPVSGGSGSGAEIDFSGQDLSQPDYSAGYYRDGGAVKGKPKRLALNYADGGPISGRGTGTSDSVPGRVQEGSYILSADTVRAIGEQKIMKMHEAAGVRPGFGGDDKGGMPVRLSNGEWQIPPPVVQFHGEEYFNKLQQKYHRPVLGQDGMANGGALRQRALPAIVENAIHRAMPGHALTRRRNY